MKTSTEKSNAQKQQDIVVGKLWEIYLLYHPANLYKILTEHSLDNGPVGDQQSGGRVQFRFLKHAWENRIKKLLYDFRIPVVLQSNQLDADKVKGRQPVLR